MPTDDLTIAFVSFGSLNMIVDDHRDLLECGRFDIRIVENDAEVKEVDLAHFPRVELIWPGQNLGYGRAANFVLQQVETSHVLLLNPDVKVSAEGIKALLECVGEMDPAPAAAAPATLEKDHLPGEPPRNVAWLSGCAMLLEVAAMRELGGFDENIFLYSEDTELCQRLAAAGKRMVLCPAIHFPHDIGTSTGSGVAMERFRWWHFGWSNSYRVTKHGWPNRWKTPRNKMWRWRIRSWLSLSPKARRKWRAKSDGAAAFLRGEGAFEPDGKPREYKL